MQAAKKGQRIEAAETAWDMTHAATHSAACLRGISSQGPGMAFCQYD